MKLTEEERQEEIELLDRHQLRLEQIRGNLCEFFTGVELESIDFAIGKLRDERHYLENAWMRDPSLPCPYPLLDTRIRENQELLNRVLNNESY